MISLIADLLQMGVGLFIAGAGYHISHEKWPRTPLDYYAGTILMVLGLIVALMPRRGL
jgi:hypothetical protein